MLRLHECVCNTAIQNRSGDPAGQYSRCVAFSMRALSWIESYDWNRKHSRMYLNWFTIYIFFIYDCCAM